MNLAPRLPDSPQASDLLTLVALGMFLTFIVVVFA